MEIVPSLADRLARCVDRLFPDATIGALRNPASKDLLNRLERLTGTSLPSTIKELYLKFDGQQRTHMNRPTEAVCPLIFPSYRWCSLEEMTERWTALNSIEWDPHVNSGDDSDDCRIRDYQYHSKWLPVGFSVGSNIAFIDFHPGSCGKVGQIIESDFVMPPRLLGHSLASCFEQLLNSIEAGRLVARAGEWRDSDGRPCILPPVVD